MNHQEECGQHDGDHFDLLSTSISSNEVNPRITVTQNRVGTLMLRQCLLDPPPRQAVLASSAGDAYREVAPDYGIHNLGRCGIGHPLTVTADEGLIQPRFSGCG